MKTRTIGRWVFPASVALVFSWFGIAAAQEAAPESKPKADDTKPNTTPKTKPDETIVVTAERRSKPLQISPISATVFSGDDLADKGVNSVEQIMFVTPSATVNSFGQGIDFNIRGIGKGEHNTQTTTGVITYRDGVATFAGYITGEPYYDIGSVEILRGPQGTFVGQNATGGAVFVNSNNPIIGGGHTGYVQGQLGNYRDVGLQGALNIPLGDTLAARIAFNSETRDSFWKIDGPYSGSDARLRTHSGRIGLLWQPTSALSVLFKTDYSRLDFGAYPGDPVNATNDLFHITANAELQALDELVRSVLSVDYTFANGMKLRSVSGYQDGNTSYKADLDGSSAINWAFKDSVDNTIYSQELNLISPNTGRTRWVLGTYWQKDTLDFLPKAFVVATPPGSPFTEYVLDGTNVKKNTAVFGKIGFDLTDRLEFEIGARRSKSTTLNDVNIVQYGTPLTSDQFAEYRNTSGKASLNFKLDKDHFLYAFAATGFKPGGLSVNIGLGLPPPFGSEKVKSYEAGWKSNWLGGQLSTQFTAFRNEYDNFQVIVRNPATPTTNIELNVPDTTTISGFEAQAQARFGNWKADAGLGLMRSRVGNFYAADPRGAAAPVCNPLTGPSAGTCRALGGQDQTYAPDLTFNFSVQRAFHLDSGTVTPRINFAHVSEQWATLFQNAALGDRIASRNIVNAQIAWLQKGFEWTLYGTNLTDRHYVTAINSGLRLAGPPRQYGLRVLKWF